MRLKDYADEYEELLALLDADEEEAEGLAEAVQNALDEMLPDIHRKVDGIVSILRDLESSADACDAEAKRLAARKRRFQDRADWLRRYLKSAAQKMNGKIETDTNTVSLSKPSKCLQVVASANIPYEYLIEQEPVLDKAALKKALKDGVVIEGAALVDGEPGLLIR